jgi:hypothetical protein
MPFRYQNLLLTFLFFILLATGCMKQESYPDTPQIELNSFTLVFDSTDYAVQGVLSISFKDGNGDLGLSDGDTLYPYMKDGSYYYNLVIPYFVKQNGAYQQVNLNPPLSGRFPLLSPNFPNKAIKGVIEDKLPMDPMPAFDTVKLEAFLYDRALNKSNVLTIPEIILRRY